MSSVRADDQDDLMPSTTPGYKPSAAKTTDEYAKLDAGDESLNRWKASLGIVPGTTTGDATGPKLTVLTLELLSPTLPADKKLAFDLTNPATIADIKKNPVIIKEGIEYNVRITFRVNHSIISGVRYIQLGSYNVRSRVIDDDNNVYADWEWSFKLAKEW
ncbi:immunoglobulin E-set [Scleroderma yunnanense]